MLLRSMMSEPSSVDEARAAVAMLVASLELLSMLVLVLLVLVLLLAALSSSMLVLLTSFPMVLLLLFLVLLLAASALSMLVGRNSPVQYRAGRRRSQRARACGAKSSSSSVVERGRTNASVRCASVGKVSAAQDMLLPLLLLLALLSAALASAALVSKVLALILELSLLIVTAREVLVMLAVL